MVLLQISVVLILFTLSWLCAIPLQEWEEKAGVSEGNNCPSVKPLLSLTSCLQSVETNGKDKTIKSENTSLERTSGSFGPIFLVKA